MNLLLNACAGTLAAVLVTSAVLKLLDVDATVRHLRGYELLPRRAAGPAATLLVLAELAVATSLVQRGLLATPSALGVTVLSAVFATAMGVNLLRGRREIACGCWGSRSTPISWSKVLVAACLAAAPLPVLQMAASLGFAGPSPSGWAERATLGAGLAIAYALTRGLRAVAREVRAAGEPHPGRITAEVRARS